MMKRRDLLKLFGFGAAAAAAPAAAIAASGDLLPGSIEKHARPFDVELIILRYQGDSYEEALRASGHLLKQARKSLGCERVVVYPESYVPVIISKRRMEEVQKLVGPEMLPISPGMEWPPVE